MSAVGASVAAARATLMSVLLALAGCGAPTGSACAPARLATVTQTPSYAVVTSDYSATAVALLDADGALLEEAWIDSGTAEVGLAATLNGDVVLPSASLRDGALTLLDRFATDVLTRVPLAPPLVPVQAEVRASAASRGWSPNPHDVAAHAPGRLVLTRFERNPAPDAPPLDRGDDVVVLDLAARAVVARVDLSALGALAEGEPVAARPDGLARAGAFHVAGLARLSADFMRAGPGAVAVVDVDAGTAYAVPLEGFAYCGEVRALDAPLAEPPAVAGDVDVVALCQGATFVDEAARRAGAGIAVVRVGAAGGARVVRTWRAADHTEVGSPTNLVAVLDAGRVVYAARGEGASANTDRLVAVALSSGEARTVYVSPLRFALQGGAYDAARGLLLVPEGTLGVRRFDVGAALDVTPRDTVDVSPCRGLPARQVGAL